MRDLLEFGYFCLLLFTAGFIRIWVLFEGGSLSRIYGILLRLNYGANTISMNYFKIARMIIQSRNLYGRRKVKNL